MKKMRICRLFCMIYVDATYWGEGSDCPVSRCVKKQPVPQRRLLSSLERNQRPWHDLRPSPGPGHGSLLKTMGILCPSRVQDGRPPPAMKVTIMLRGVGRG